MPDQTWPCHFCRTPCTAADWHAVQFARAGGAAAREHATFPVCAKHLQVLRGAGERGRVHRWGLRWWLVEE